MRADLAIVGLGTAGAALAGFASERGLSVIGIERQAAKEAGARWINGVPGWAFDDARLARPTGAELFGSGHELHLLAGFGPRRVTVRGHDVLEVDMRHLVERLQSRALAQGVRFLEHTRVTGFDGRQLETSAGAVSASWFVDASGLAGARLLQQPRVVKGDICAAAQEVRAVTNLSAAQHFFEQHGVSPGNTLCFTGVAGGFSVVNVRLVGDCFSILTGSIPGDGHASGRALIDQFVAEHDFVGPVLFGGARAIPLSRPLDVLGRDNVALLGDAGRQVFSAHGSGIGAGLLAARMLADTLGDGLGPHTYALRWHRKYGGLFATFEAFRRFSQQLSAEDLGRMMSAGLLDVRSARAGLEQRVPRPSPAVVANALRGAVSERRIARRLVPALTRGAAASLLYGRYPEEPSGVPDWSAKLDRILG
ncbi:MAG: hypothetical protein IPI67_28820 [Myxococcales bacterium]|nr:hypothetical protein [Myxococcales bacterium]